MDRAAVKADLLRYRLRAAAHELGRAGVLGLGLLAGALGFYLSAVGPAREEVAALQARAAELAKQGRQGARSAPAPATPAQIDRFKGFFPALESAPDWLRTLYGLAEREQLELQQGIYRLSDDRVLGLSQYRISLPVRGSYPQIRRFIAGALDAVPALSLEEVTFQREKIGDGAIEAKIGLSLHLRSAPGPALAVGAL
jgi:hypothetical protein